MEQRAGESNRKKSEIECKALEPERRMHPRTEGVLGRIEDITYALLRKHMDKTAQ